ncbi:MAG: NADH-quinone oxidoreductase subunit N [Nitriliruptoraceae bacterium]
MQIDFVAILPEIVLTVTALLVLAADLALRGDAKQLVNPVAGIGTVGAIIATVYLWGEQRTTFNTMYVVDDFAVIFKLFFLGSLLAILGISWRYFAEDRFFQGEYYFLLLTAFIGMLLMPSSRDLLLLFVALETVSIPAFVMVGLRKRDLYSSESALKFFLIGVLSVALMLFGISMVYGFTGSTDLVEIAAAIEGETASVPLLLGSVMLVMVGFGFKISAVPFHFWAPDTYAGAPMPVAAMLAVASKAAGFVGLLVIAFVAFEPLAEVWAPVLGVLAIVTMTVGNLIALQQRDLIRLLAYSSVAHAGYMLIPFGLARSGAGGELVNDAAIAAVLFYLIAYAVMNIGAFGVAIAVNRRTGLRAIRDYAGLSTRSPLLSMGLTVFLLSLGGAPLTVGLWAKFAIIEAIAVDITLFGVVLASFLVVNSVIAFFYYLKVIRAIWMEPAREGLPALQPGFNLSAVVVVLMVFTMVLGILPGLVSDYSSVANLVASG